MASWVAWVVFLVVAAALRFVAGDFSLRTVRYFTAGTAIALVVAVTMYGLTHPAQSPQSPPDLETAFARGADAVAAALFHPLWLGHPVPEPGRVGWAVITVSLIIGYRQLEAWAFRNQAPVIDTSKL